ncbi:hypothetical protein E2I00_011305, partial [Balaenoptera physalus]
QTTLVCDIAVGRAGAARALVCSGKGRERRLKTCADPGDPTFHRAAGAGGGTSTHFPLVLSRQGVFAQLVVADGVQLTEGPLHWCSERGMTGVTLAPGVSYDKHTHEVVVAQAGVYYVFLHLALKRAMASNGNSSGSVSVALRLRPLQAGAAALALTLDLPPPSSGNSAAGFRSGLLHLDAGQRLSVDLRLAVREPRAWQLSADATVWGLFHVATQGPPDSP